MASFLFKKTGWALYNIHDNPNKPIQVFKSKQRAIFAASSEETQYKCWKDAYKKGYRIVKVKLERTQVEQKEIELMNKLYKKYHNKGIV